MDYALINAVNTDAKAAARNWGRTVYVIRKADGSGFDFSVHEQTAWLYRVEPDGTVVKRTA